MLGSLNLSIPDIENPPLSIIIGGGLSGLLFAYKLAEKGHRVAIYEKSSRLGGLINSEEVNFGLTEAAAGSIRATNKVLDLLSQLEVPYLELNEGASAKFILRNGFPKKFPLSFFEILASIPNLFRGYVPECSVEEFGRRQLGNKALDYLIDPIVSGIYGCSPDMLDMSIAFPSLGLKKGQSIISFILSRLLKRTQKGRPKMIIPSGGMLALINAIESKLENNNLVDIKLDTKVENLEDLQGFSSAHNIILATPAHAAKELLVEQNPSYSERLGDLAYTPLVVVHLFIKKKQFAKLPHGIGVLVPRKENYNTLGVLFCSSSFMGYVNNDEYINLRFIMGGSSNPDVVNFDDETLIKHAFEFLSKVYGVKGRETESKIYRWPNAVPVYSKELKAILAEFNATNFESNIVITSNFTNSLSVRAMIEEVQLL